MKKLFKYFLLCFSFAVGINFVSADSEYVTYTSASKYKIDVVAETGSAGAGLYVYLNGSNSNLESGDNIEYYTYFVNSKSDKLPDMIGDRGDCDIESSRQLNNFNSTLMLKDNENDAQVLITDDWYLASGYDYAYIVKKTYNRSDYKYYCEATEEPIQVDRPDLPTLENRYHVFVFGDEDQSLSVFPYFPHDGFDEGRYGESKMITKIGLVNDDNILNKFRAGASDSYSSLLQYAKNNDGKTWTYYDYDKFDMPLDGFNVINGAYYYIYTTYTDSDSLYRNLDGVSLVMGENDMLVNDIVWDSNYEDISYESLDGFGVSAENITNPKTGILSIYLASAAMIISLISLLIYKRKVTSSN